MLRSHIRVLLAALMLTSGCASTRIVNTWREPAFKGPITFKKTLIAVVHPLPEVRKAAEDELVFQIGSQRAVPAHQVLTEEERKDVNKLKAKVQAGGFDGVVTMRVVDKRSQTSVESASVPEDFYESYDRGIQLVADPTYTRTVNIVSVKTNIYSVADAKLIWSGTSESFDPTQVEDFVAEIAKAVGEALRREKLLT
jgi:hypothetical protein